MLLLLLSSRVSILFEDVQAQTGIEPAAQQYLFLGHPLILEPSMKIVNLPPTTPDRPIILISRHPEKLVGHPYKERTVIINVFFLCVCVFLIPMPSL